MTKPAVLEFTESLDAPAEYPPAPPTPMNMTWGQFFDAVNPALCDKLLEFAEGDERKAEEWLAEVLVTIVSACRPS